MEATGMDTEAATEAITDWLRLDNERCADEASLCLAGFAAEWGDDRADLIAALADFVSENLPHALPDFMAPVVPAIVAAADLAAVLGWLDGEDADDE